MFDNWSINSNHDLTAKIQRLEDIEAIRNLKARYCAFCDDGYDPDGIASLFVEEGIWEGGIRARGKHEGREAIRSYFTGTSSRITFSVHNAINPIIEVDGDTAHASWNLFQPCTESGQAYWVSGVYQDDYVKVDGQWFFKHLRITFNFWTPFEQGWDKQPFPNP